MQEATDKWPALRQRFPGIELHLIGPLQSNKAREAVDLFDAIHTIDRPKIAQALAHEMAKQRKRLKLFIEVNTGEEPQKAGVLPKEAADLLRLCREELELDIAGLMCIPPLDEEAAVHFAFLAKLGQELGLKELSMGMSADFETAVAFGATYVRVGTQIFGHRPPPRPGRSASGWKHAFGMTRRAGTRARWQPTAHTAFFRRRLRRPSPAPMTMLTSPRLIRAIPSPRARRSSRGAASWQTEAGR